MTIHVAQFVFALSLALLSPSQSQTVVDIVVNDPQLTILESLVVATPGLVDTLNALPNDVTLFAPTDDAFAAVSDITLTNEQIVSILQYHVVTTGEIFSQDIVDGLSLPTVQGESVVLTVNSTGVFVNEQSPVVQADIVASNGVVHKIGNIPLLPKAVLDELAGPPPTATTTTPPMTVMPVPAPTPTAAPPSTTAPGNIVEVAVSLAPQGFSTLVDLVVLADLDEVLANAVTVTVLAPTDEAFAKLDANLVAALTTPPYKFHLQEILLYHTFESLLKSPNLLNSQAVLSVGGLYLTTQNTDKDRVQFKSRDGTTLLINNGAAKVVVADVTASNGIIHAIDNVLLPSFVSKTVTTRIREDRGDLRTLYSLLQQAGLTEVLEGDGPFTVFAPIDEAFAGIDGSDLDDTALQAILTYHVVPGMYPSSLIQDGLQLTTVQGQNITFTVSSDLGVVTLNDGIPIETTDTVAINGIVHKIGGILMPSMP